MTGRELIELAASRQRQWSMAMLHRDYAWSITTAAAEIGGGMV